MDSVTESRPLPTEPVLEAKPAVSTPKPEAEAEQRSSESTAAKSEMNGHASLPASSNGVADAEKTLTNGDANHHSETNGVTQATEVKNDVETVKFPESPKDRVMDGTSEAKEETALPAPEPAKDPETEKEPEREEDIRMTDAAEPVPSSEAVQAQQSTLMDPKPQVAEPEAEASDEIKAPETAEVKALSADPPTEEAEKPSQNAEEDLPVTSEVDLHPASLSQLAIESTESGLKPVESAPVEATTDVAMTDAPASKIAREREEDTLEEPAPKRAKTEPLEEGQEKPAAGTPTTAEPVENATSADATPSSTLSSLARWDDDEFLSKTITPHQRRESRNVIARIKKTKNGHSFRDSVQKLWPQLAEAYLSKIEKPMDLGEIDRNLKDANGLYIKFGDLKKDLALIHENTNTYNGPTHEVTGWALNAVRNVWESIISVPDEEPERPKSLPKSKPVRESRTATIAEAAARRESMMASASATAPAAAPPLSAKAASNTQSQSSASQQSATIRGTSIAEGDRPKRTVRQPKSRDIDYTQPSRKKMKPELQFCDEVLTEIRSLRHANVTQFFQEPVDAEGLGIPTYYSVVKKPMSLSELANLLTSGHINSLKEFDKTFKLIISNCYLFNGPPEQGNIVSIHAKELEGLYSSLMKGKDAWLSRQAKAAARQRSGSNDSDEDDEGEESEGGDAGAMEETTNKLRDLESRLNEETGKLNKMYLADSPNADMIELQQHIVSTVQKAILKAKQEMSELRQRPEKPSKKVGKGTKAKNAGPRKSGGAGATKKSGGKKAAVKKSLTAADKDQIANAINDLEYPHLERAIDIIKRDTGQAENTDGELELDIDQLSTEALLKLWELCKKVLPSFAKEAAISEARATPSKSAAKAAAGKPKKNKPMSAQEQEARIAQLRDIREMYKGGPDSGDAGQVTQAPTPNADDTSDDSDSEEE